MKSHTCIAPALGGFRRIARKSALERYRQKWVKPGRGPVYFVVVGASDSEFRDMLYIWFNHVNSTITTFFESPKFHLVKNTVSPNKGNMEALSSSDFKAAFKQYRKDVPSVGVIDSETADRYLAGGRICRGWTNWDGHQKYFHIVKSPGSYPEKSIFYGRTEHELFETTIYFGFQNSIPLMDLFTD